MEALYSVVRVESISLDSLVRARAALRKTAAAPGQKGKGRQTCLTASLVGPCTARRAKRVGGALDSNLLYISYNDMSNCGFQQSNMGASSHVRVFAFLKARKPGPVCGATFIHSAQMSTAGAKD